MNIISSDYEMLWHSVWLLYECRSLWPIFHGPVILLYIWKTIWHMNIILPDYEWYDPIIHLNMNVSHCDLYFMVQWFCFISESPFDIKTSYREIMKWYDTMIHLNIAWPTCHGSVISAFTVQWFCPISESPFEIWTSYLQIMNCYDTVFDLNMNVLSHQPGVCVPLKALFLVSIISNTEINIYF